MRLNALGANKDQELGSEYDTLEDLTVESYVEGRAEAICVYHFA